MIIDQHAAHLTWGTADETAGKNVQPYRQVIDEVVHSLPAHGSISAFVHHNTLHGIAGRKFEPIVLMLKAIVMPAVLDSSERNIVRHAVPPQKSHLRNGLGFIRLMIENRRSAHCAVRGKHA